MIRQLAVIAFFAVSPLTAQVAVGTTQGAATVLKTLKADADAVGQSFTAAGRYMTRLSIWYHGGAISPRYAASGYDYYSLLTIGNDAGAMWGDPGMYQAHLNQNIHGRHDIVLDYLSVVVGQVYWFGIFTDLCTDDQLANGCNPLGFSAPVGAERQSSLEVTVSDAYGGGYAIQWGGAAITGDVRFEATFADTRPVVSVPEPISILLLATGLLGIGMAARKREE